MFETALAAFVVGAEDGCIGSWSPGIGDPTFIGWFTAVAYFIAARLCWLAYRRLRAFRKRSALAPLAPMLLAPFVSRRRLLALPEEQRVASFWLGMTVILVCLGINKQLDLQTALTEIGRILARDEGWYSGRRTIQAVFVFAVLLAGAWLFRSLLNLTSGKTLRLLPILTGMVLVIVFVTIRAASFHHVDVLLGAQIGAFKLNWVIEVGGIALVVYGTYRAAPRRARKQAA